MTKTKKIIISVYGGVVQEIVNIPEGVEVHVYDYDNDPSGKEVDIWKKED